MGQVTNKATTTQKQVVDSAPLIIICLLLVSLAFVGARYYQSLMTAQYDSINLATVSVVTPLDQLGVAAETSVTQGSDQQQSPTQSNQQSNPKVVPASSTHHINATALPSSSSTPVQTPLAVPPTDATVQPSTEKSNAQPPKQGLISAVCGLTHLCL